MTHPVQKSLKLAGVCYDIRGPVLREARRMEEEGHRITKLNIGNPAPFGLEAPERILQDVIHNLPDSTGYCDSKGLFSARNAVVQYYEAKGIAGLTVEDVYLGNGVSELIVMAMQALLNNGDEMLIPAPDYPLWTAAVSLSGGTPVHYRCDESAGWSPDPDHIRARISERTRGIVLINPNNPTGAVYPRELIEEIIGIAREHHLIIFADEIYEKIVFDETAHYCVAELCDDVLVATFNGLSKTYRIAGFRTGWMLLSGNRERARDYIEGLEILSSMRLCANVPAQHAIQSALGGYQSIEDLIRPGGRLHRQRELAWQQLTAIPGVSCVKPGGALYMFPKLDPAVYPVADDEEFALQLLRQEKVLIVQGSGFNLADPQHFRLVFLPHEEDLAAAIEKIAHFLHGYGRD